MRLVAVDKFTTTAKKGTRDLDYVYVDRVGAIQIANIIMMADILLQTANTVHI